MAPFESDAATLDNVTDISDARKSKKSAKSPSGEKAKKKSGTSNRKIDYEKIAKLKAEIDAGSYKIDAARIADKFIEREGK